MNRVDARGMSCPQPILMTKKALENSPKELEVLVDNTTASRNVERFFKSQGYKVQVSSLNDEDYMLKGVK